MQTKLLLPSDQQNRNMLHWRISPILEKRSHCCCQATNKTETCSVEGSLQYWRRGARSFWWLGWILSNQPPIRKICVHSQPAIQQSFSEEAVVNRVCPSRRKREPSLCRRPSSSSYGEERTCATIQPSLRSIPHITHSRLIWLPHR